MCKNLSDSCYEELSPLIRDLYFLLLLGQAGQVNFWPDLFKVFGIEEVGDLGLLCDDSGLRYKLSWWFRHSKITGSSMPPKLLTVYSVDVENSWENYDYRTI